MSEDHDDSQLNSNNQFGLRTFSTDVLIYAGGQGILLLLSFIQGLIVPKFLSVESYGYFQVFRLYASYGGILHLGFVDGALVRWAGKGLDQIGNELKAAFRFLLLELAVIIAPLSLLPYFLLEPPFQQIALMVLAFAFVVDLGYLFIFTAQAARRFKLLTAVNVGGGLVSLILIIVFFVASKLDYNYVIFALLASQLLFTLALVWWFHRYLGGKTTSSPSLWAYGKENIGIGIFVLLGNFIIILFLTGDRLMVSSFFSLEQFAIYAFALGVAGVVYVFITAISQVFFPYLTGAAPELRTRAYQLGKPAIILAWAGILAIYFPVARLVQFYLPHYTASLPIMQILLCTVGFGSLIQILHVNYYKAYRRQRQYFLYGIVALAILAISNLLAIKIWGTLESIAIATFISFGVWYIINELGLKAVVGESHRGLWKSLGIICCYLGAFWVSSQVTDWFIAQMLIYGCFFFLGTWLFFRNTVKELAVIVNDVRRRQS